MIEEEPDDPPEGAPAWMATFADLSTLLLTFFVLLLSFATMDIVNFRSALGSVRDALGVQFEHKGEVMGLTSSVVEMSKQESTPNVQVVDVNLIERITQVVKESKHSDKLETFVGERGVVVRVRDQVLFASGSDELLPAAAEVLQVIADVCAEVPLPVWIEGHTDNAPIQTVRFPSNWELSAARSTAAMRLLMEQGVDEERMRVAGYAHVRPLEPNDTPEGRAHNRRVEFVFLSPPKASEDAVEAAHAAGTKPGANQAPIRAKDLVGPPGAAKSSPSTPSPATPPTQAAPDAAGKTAAAAPSLPAASASTLAPAGLATVSVGAQPTGSATAAGAAP